MPDFDSLSRSAAGPGIHHYRFPHEPTRAQLDAGVYPKRKIPWHGLTISIENEAGSVRRGTKPDGTAWETRIVHPYGYINRTEGVDGDHIDVFVGPDLDAPLVYIVHARKVGDWEKYDEDKCMLGYRSEDEAVHSFLLNYDDDRFLGPVTAMPVDEFKRKVLAADGQMIKSSNLKSQDVISSLDFGEMMLKGDYAPIPAGAHWITVHSSPGAKGNPILVMPQSDGSMRVIGGAGGALNHLKLRSVKTGESYKQSIAERHQQRQEAQKQQTAADKAAGTFEAKQQAKAGLKQSMQAARQDFVKTVSQMMGWDEKETAFDEEANAGLSDEALAKVRKTHDKEIFSRARAAVEVNRRLLLQDHEALAASGLGEIPLTDPSPDQVSVADLDPLPEKNPGLGFATNYGKRAAEKGLTHESVESELANVHGAEPTSPEQLAKQAEKKDISAKLDQEIEDFRLANPETVKANPKILVDAKKAAGLVLAQKKLKLLEQSARQASQELASAKVVESKAYVLEVSDAEVEDAARQQMEQDIKTIGAVGLLSEIGKMGGEESLGGHVGAGAFNALNAAAQVVAGDSMIDRSVVDVLGINAAAQIIARRVAKDYEAGDLDRIRNGMEKYHIDSQNDIQEGAVKEARELVDAANAIEIPDAKTGDDLANAQQINHQRRLAVDQAKRVLGQATGELQANAALVQALREGTKDQIEVSLGKTDPKSAITQLHALGLESGDYKLEEVGGTLVATVNGAGLDKIAGPVDVAGLKQISRNIGIMSGKEDEEGWLPKGFASRPDLSMKAEPGVADRLAQPFTPGPDLGQSLKDYIGGRAADGDSPADIMADIQSADFFQKSGDNDGYRKALDAVAPLTDASGKMRPAESLSGEFDKMADDYVGKMGGKLTPFQRQKFAVDQKSVDALHRALSETPEGVAAFKEVGELSPQDRTGLRKWFQANIAKEDAAGKEAREALEAHEANEPTKEAMDMFGDKSVTPEWSAWKQQRDEMAGKESAGLDWNKYVKIMGSPEAAIKSVQDLVRSHVVSKFAEVHNTLNPKNPIKIGKSVISGNLNHLSAVDPAAREKRLQDQAALVDSLREQSQGKYAAGSVSEKIEAQQEAKAAFEQSQMGFFSADGGDHVAGAGKKVGLAADERNSIGHAAEQQLAGMMSVVGQNFKPGQPTKLWQTSMDKKFIAQQRAIKFLEANKRMVLAYGAGSGKTNVYLGSFSQLHETGKIKRAVMLVPSVVQGQFGSEALRSLEPGKFNWSCQPGASQAERIAAYKDPKHDFVVQTHEAFRADMIHLGAQHSGVSDDEMNNSMNAMSAGERKDWIKSVMEKEGIAFDATMVDEGHQILNRAGKENSARANVIDSLMDNTEYAVSGSGDPVKNDASELHDLMAKMDRKRYGDRDAFMRKYGGDTIAAKAGLRREMARYVIANTISSGMQADHEVEHVDLSAGQKSALKSLDKSMAKASAAEQAGTVDLAACKAISPDAFKDIPAEHQETVARRIQKSLGIVKDAAVARVINTHKDNPKIDKMLDLVKQHGDQQGVVFAHNRAAVAEIEKRLTAAGKRVVVISGADSAKEKDVKRLMFNPESGAPSADILVASDAAAVGMNLQSGQYLIQHDTSMTAMTHAQRNARIDRLGQKHNVELIDMVANHPSEQRARDRLARKYQLREFMLDPLSGLDDSGIAGYLQPKLTA